MQRRPRRIGLVVVAAVALALAGVGGALANRAAQARRWALDARAALARGQFAEAAAHLAPWLARAPGDPVALALQGRAALGLGRVSDAADAWRRVAAAAAAAAGQPGPDARVLRALLAVAAGRATEVDAEAELAEVFAHAGPVDRQVVEALSRLRMARFDLAGSLVVLDRWRAAAPTDPEPVVRRAEVLARTGADPERLANEYRAALGLAPDRTDLRLKLAATLLDGHRPEEAQTEYDAVLAGQPNEAAAHLGAARAAGALGDEVVATRHLAQALALVPTDPEVYRITAEAAQRREDWPAALQALDRAVALDPFDAETFHRRALALTHLDRPAEARAERTRSAQLRADLTRLNEARARLVAQPDDLPSQLAVARWMFSHGHDAEGVRWAEQILLRRPDEPAASRLLADHYRRRGDMGRANFHALHADREPSSGAPPGP